MSQQNKTSAISCTLTLVLTLINTGVLAYVFFVFPKTFKKELRQTTQQLQLELIKNNKNDLSVTAKKLAKHIDNKFSTDLPKAIELHSPKIPKETGPAIYID
jgi:Na+-translocating ferredoxin:NAD+ oxidoreductase RnfG subunit